MRRCLGGQIGFDDHHDLQEVGNRFVACVQLLAAGFDSVGDGGLAQRVCGHGARIALVAVDAVRPAPGLWPGIREVHRTIAAQFGNQVELALPGHRERIIIANMAIQHQIGQREQRADTGQQGADHGLDPCQLGGQIDGGFGGGGAPFRSARLPFEGRWGGVGPCCGFFLRGAQDLLDGDGKRAPRFGADQRQGETCQSRHGFAIQTGKEAIQARRVLAGFGDNRFITAEQIDLISAEEMGAKEQPEHTGPGDAGMEQALDGALAAAIARPASNAAHGDAPGHGQHGQRDSAALADGGQRDLRLKA